MGIVVYLSREPNGEPWPESELDERFVVTSIESFHKALDFGLLEKHLFRRKFGSEALNINRSWNAEWRVPLNFEEEHEEREGK